MSLKISSTLSLPRETSTWVLAFLAKRGAGKTYSAADLAEEMVKSKIPIVVIDGMGIWWGLRVSKDEKSDGLPIVVFGGEHQDLPLSPDNATKLARAIVESNISAVLDLSGFSKGQSKKIVSSFLDELYKMNRVERHVFIEEADLWAPQRTIGPEEAICLGAVSNFVRRGGNHNLGCTLITQRSAVLNKDVLTQADCLVILRTLAPQDKKAIQLWVEEMTDKDRRELEKWYDSLKELDNGEAWVWHPESPAIYKKVQFRPRETFHATRKFILSPLAGSIKLMPVDEFISRFKSVFEPKPREVPKQMTVEAEFQHKTSWGIEPKLSTPAVHTREDSIGPQPGVPVSASLKIERPEVRPSDPVVPTGNPPSVNQALPNLEIHQFKPQLNIPVELLDQPTTILGRVCVVLYNDPTNGNKWSQKRIVRDINDHGWDAAGVDGVIEQLLHWEVLDKHGQGGMLRVHRDRIKVVDHGSNFNLE
jgi:hypothetical protein